MSARTLWADEVWQQSRPWPTSGPRDNTLAARGGDYAEAVRRTVNPRRVGTTHQAPARLAAGIVTVLAMLAGRS
jgi:hypothetical protein